MTLEGEIKLKDLEPSSERSHRHKREVRRFWIKEALIHLSALASTVSGTIAALVLMFRPGSSDEDKKWAFSVLSHLLVAIAGFAFGKAAT